jgi:enamine deaminase RidA (YjgF/YER057c/UK114 family)
LLDLIFMKNLFANDNPRLRFARLDAAACRGLAPASQYEGGFERALGVVWFGAPPTDCSPQMAEVPFMSVPMPLLQMDGTGTGELWLGGAVSATKEFEGIRYRADGDVLFGTLTIGGEDSHLAVDSRSVYERMFRLLDQAGYPHLWRTWNFLSDIHGNDQGLERYRQFNVGRQAAYDARQQMVESTAPAACALGMRDGGFCVGFLAGRVAPILLENPRQVSAYHYPDTYGPRSPTFSRATLIPLVDSFLLLISGTASIVGHESRHIGNVRAQTRETLANISEIVAQANDQLSAARANDRLTQGPGFMLADLQLRVYVRHPEDADAVRRELGVCLGAGPGERQVRELNVCFVQADVCRQELLVEIEASGWVPRTHGDQEAR